MTGPSKTGILLGMGTLNREQGWALLCEWTPSDALRRHARSVEIALRAAALHYGEGTDDGLDETARVERWGLAGMLHDADYDSWPDEHPQRIVAWLREHDEPELAHAISAHYTQWGVPYDSLLDKALLACDELTGFIGACCHVRPGGIATLEARSVVKKLKKKEFAAKVERHEVHTGVELLGVDLKEHIAFLIDALRPHGEELGWQGQG